jgi:hypothetical protein
MRKRARASLPLPLFLVAYKERETHEPVASRFPPAAMTDESLYLQQLVRERQRALAAEVRAFHAEERASHAEALARIHQKLSQQDGQRLWLCLRALNMVAAVRNDIQALLAGDLDASVKPALERAVCDLVAAGRAASSEGLCDDQLGEMADEGMTHMV